MAGIFDPGIFDSGIFDDAPPEGAFQSDTFQSDAFQEDASGAVTATTTDAPTTSDAATRTGVLARSLTDAPQTSDVVTRAVAVLRTTSEAFSSSESVVAGRLIARSTTDVSQTSDAAAAFTHYGSVEAPHTSDVVTRSAVLSRAATDSVYMAQVITRIATFPRTTTEAISTSESVVHGPTAVTTDHPVATVVATRAMVLSRTASDGIRGSDVVINHNTPFVEGTAIYIGGTNVSKGDGDPALYASARFMSAVNGVAGEAHLRVRDDTGTMVYTVGDPLELVIDGQRVWTGFVMKVTRTYVFPALNVAEFGPTRFFDIEGSDLNLLLTRRIVFKDSAPEDITAPLYPPHTPDVTAMSALFAHWLDLSGDGLDTSTDVHNVADINEDQQARAWEGSDTWADAMKSIAALPAAIFYIRPNWLFAYVDTDTPDAPFGLSDDPDGVTSKGYREAEILLDGTNLANDVLAFGVGYGSNAPVVDRLRDTTSISDHGTWQLGQTTFGVYKQNTINRIASSIVNGSPEHHRGAKDDRHAVTLTTYEKGLLPAQKVNFESNVFGFSEVLPIRKMEVTFDAPDVPKYTFVLSNEIDTPWSFFDPYPPFQFPGFKMPGIGQITVTPPPNIQLPSGCQGCGTTDTFIRGDTVSPSWGIADDDTSWVATATNTATTVAVANIVGNEGHLFVPVVTGVSGGSGGSATATLPGHLPTTVLMDFEFPQWNPSGDTGNMTQALSITSGSYSLSLNAKDPTNGELLILSAPPSSTANVAYSFSPSTLYHLRWEITGTESRVRVWTGGVEPSTWDLTLTTSVALGTNSFQIGLLSVRGNNSAHNEAVEVNFSLLELSTSAGVINRCTQFMFDNFNRVVAANSWGISTDGHTWTANLTTGATWSVDGTGIQRLASGTSNEMRLLTNGGGPWTNAAWTMTMDFIITNKGATGGHTIIDVVNNSDVRVTGIDLNSAGSLFAGAAAGSPSTAFTYVTGTLYHLVWEMVSWVGTAQHWRAKIYADGAADPGWMLDYTDASRTPQDANNHLIVYSSNQSSSSIYRVTIDFINFDYAGKPCYIDCTGTPDLHLWDDFSNRIIVRDPDNPSWGSPSEGGSAYFDFGSGVIYVNGGEGKLEVGPAAGSGPSASTLARVGYTPLNPITDISKGIRWRFKTDYVPASGHGTLDHRLSMQNDLQGGTVLFGFTIGSDVGSAPYITTSPPTSTVTSTDVAWAANTWYWVQIEQDAFGARMKFWLDGNPEPSTYLLNVAHAYFSLVNSLVWRWTDSSDNNATVAKTLSIDDISFGTGCVPVTSVVGGAVFGAGIGIAAVLIDSTHYTINRSVQPGTAQVSVGGALVSPVTDYAIDTETGIISFATAIDPATPVTVVIVTAAGPPVTPPPTTLPPGGTFSTLIFDDDFNRTIAEGHFLDGGTSYIPGAAYYRTSDGLYGVFKYGWSDTSGHGRYDPSIISVHDSLLDIHIQTKTDGLGTYPRVATLTCLPTGGTIKGGILGGRMRIVARADSMQYYKGVPLWWADASVTNSDLMTYGEIDWPEADFTAVPHMFVHRTNSSSLSDQYSASAPGGTSWQDWHEYITEWIPGTSVRCYIDGVLVGETFDRIPSTPMHFNLQFETGLGGDPTPAPATNGHVQIDRVQIWSYTP